MKKSIFFLSILAATFLTSCTPEELPTATKQTTINQEPQKTVNTFTVKWDSNQDGSYIEFRKHVYITCTDVKTTTEIYREREFNITLENGQTFDMQIKHTAPQKYPELYLSIWKGSEIQYEQEITTQGFLLINYCDNKGNVAQ